MLGKAAVRLIRAKFRDPRLKNFLQEPINPPPGLALKAPEGWAPAKFLERIGGDTSEYSDKFESVQEILESKRRQLKSKGIPPRQRKYIMRVAEYLRRGVLDFEALSRRTAVPQEKS